MVALLLEFNRRLARVSGFRLSWQKQAIAARRYRLAGADNRGGY